MGQEQFEAARTLGFEIRNPQRFAHNMARLSEEAGKAAAVFCTHAINLTHFTLHDDLAPAQEHWLNSNKPGCNSPTRCWKPKLHSGTTVWSCGIPRCAGSWDWRTAKQGPCRLASRRSPVQASGLVRKPLLRPAATIVPDHLALGRIPGRYGRRSRSPHPEQGSLLPDADHQCDCASNWVFTNPELLHETFASDGENLVRGMQLLAEDIERGSGHLKIRQTDATKFEVGKNLAITPGKVIFQNAVMQLIQ